MKEPGVGVVLTFIVPSSSYPSGGVAVIFEYACRMAQRGHQVHLCHTPFMRADVTRLEDIGWFTFCDGIIHHFPSAEQDAAGIPRADFIFGFIPEREHLAHTGLPVVLIQGYEMIAGPSEQDSFRMPCPKICVAGWLVDVGLGLGVPAEQLVHIPPGLRHEKYRLTRPLTPRPPRVTFCYSSHGKKNAQLAFDVLAEVRRAVPEVEVTAFGAVPPVHEVPDWVTYHTDPTQQHLVDDIYNTSRVFLCTSDVEGFGLTSIEAMACGAALVTTDNGGAREYARHEQTALVAAPRDLEALAGHVVSLLREDDRCARIAAGGLEHVKQFDWDRSTQLLESFLERYRADPAAYGYPVEGPRPAIGPSQPR